MLDNVRKMLEDWSPMQVQQKEATVLESVAAASFEFGDTVMIRGL